jgi:hypothetical protein
MTAAVGGATVISGIRALGELSVVKNNPALIIILPLFAFAITFLATSLSIMSCPFHVTVDPIPQNNTNYCLKLLLAKAQEKNM